MVASLYEVVKKIASNQESRALIIMSDQKHFCAGADLKERAGMTDEQTMAFIDQIGECFFDISALSIPTIALMNGAVLGGGLELAVFLGIEGDEAAGLAHAHGAQHDGAGLDIIARHGLQYPSLSGITASPGLASPSSSRANFSM